eukprot:COSAG02_NODE_4833_length_4924_cov_14.701175_3_plen_72_part_00
MTRRRLDPLDESDIPTFVIRTRARRRVPASARRLGLSAYKVGGDGSGAPAVSDDGGTAGEDAQGIDWLRSR